MDLSHLTEILEDSYLYQSPSDATNNNVWLAQFSELYREFNRSSTRARKVVVDTSSDRATVVETPTAPKLLGPLHGVRARLFDSALSYYPSQTYKKIEDGPKMEDLRRQRSGLTQRTLSLAQQVRVLEERSKHCGSLLKSDTIDDMDTLLLQYRSLERDSEIYELSWQKFELDYTPYCNYMWLGGHIREDLNFADELNALRRAIARLMLARLECLKRRLLKHENVVPTGSVLSLHPRRATRLSQLNSYLPISSRRMLPLEINGAIHNAIPDTGSVANIVSEEFLHLIGESTIEQQEPKFFKNACGNEFVSTQRALISCAFPGESKSHRICEFSVVTGLAAPLIIGSEFLKITETLTRYKNRLIKAAGKALAPWRLFHTQLPRQQLHCSIDGELAFANADTGSNIDLLSLDYVQQRNMKLQYVREEDSYVELANGEIARLVGQVQCELMIGDGTTSKGKRRKTFYVLPELTSDVLLGDDTLDELEVFERYQDSFFDLDDHMPSVDLIYWFGSAGWPTLEAVIEEAKVGTSDTSPSVDASSTSKFTKIFRRSKSRTWRTADILGNDERYEEYREVIANRNEREKDLSEKRISKLSGQVKVQALRDEQRRLQNHEALWRELAALHEAKKAAMSSVL